jgi:hypothetical protein
MNSTKKPVEKETNVDFKEYFVKFYDDFYAIDNFNGEITIMGGDAEKKKKLLDILKYIYLQCKNYDVTFMRLRTMNDSQLTAILNN